jgi:hypothetical protein
MTKYLVEYYFNGEGQVVIEAENPKEAEKLFMEGNFVDEYEWGDQYQIDEVHKV